MESMETDRTVHCEEDRKTKKAVNLIGSTALFYRLK